MANRFIRRFSWILLLGTIVLVLIINGVYRGQLKSFKISQLSNTTNTAKELNTTNKHAVDSTNTPSHQNPVLILYWSTYFGSPVVCDISTRRSKICNNTRLKRCKVPCEITANKSRAHNATTMIIHARDPHPLPPAKYSHIPLTLFTWEGPVHTPVLYNPTFLAHFTYLMSYRADVADFFLPTMDKPAVKPKPVPFVNKTGLIAAAFSNCEPARTAYLKELMKHIQVDSYGACLRNKRGLQDRYVGNFKQAKIKMLRNYKFTIVFHNQDCDYFVDDQLTHALDAGSIPVYMGTDKVHELLGGNLQNSIIKVKDFATPKKLYWPNICSWLAKMKLYTINI